MTKVSYSKDALAEWNQRTSYTKPELVNDVAFSKLFKKYLPINKRFHCLEIGAIPGSFLVYLHKNFGYKITGLDFAENSQVFHDNMAANKVKSYDFIKADFLKFSSKRKFDVVTSFGFIEHFDNFEEVAERHCSLVTDNGYLIITMPNFRKFQYLYHRLFDHENLKIHNTRAMNPKKISSIVKGQGFTPIFCGYTEGLKVWGDSKLDRTRTKLDSYIQALIRRFGPKLPESSLYSAAIVLIYKRSDEV